ncbi:MAG: hypothetical protein OXN97_11645 [Bryobacterales bacterium]|nr:hypothetical protein [Bryobacterales bacterium]
MGGIRRTAFCGRRALRPWHNGYRLWSVETSVERERQGTSLRAADSVQIGRTAEDGRHQDRDNVRGAGLGNVYLYQLRSDWRQMLRLPCVEAAPSRWPGGLGWQVVGDGYAAWHGIAK